MTQGNTVSSYTTTKCRWISGALYTTQDTCITGNFQETGTPTHASVLTFKLYGHIDQSHDRTETRPIWAAPRSPQTPPLPLPAGRNHSTMAWGRRRHVGATVVGPRGKGGPGPHLQPGLLLGGPGGGMGILLALTAHRLAGRPDCAGVRSPHEVSGMGSNLGAVVRCIHTHALAEIAFPQIRDQKLAKLARVAFTSTHKLCT